MWKSVGLLAWAALILSVVDNPAQRDEPLPAAAAQPGAVGLDVLAGPKRTLTVPKDHKFTDTMPRTAKDPDGNEWDPRKGVEVQSEQWIYIETAARGTIPVKLYVVSVDLRKTGLPQKAIQKNPHPVRVLRLGFETAGVPTGEPARTFTFDAPEITGQSGQPAFTIKRTPGAEPYTVFTGTPVFP
jgi:hypothetical protein